MSDSNPRTLSYIAGTLLVVLIVTGLLEARRRGRFRQTEATLVAELKLQSEAPEPSQGVNEFPQEKWDPMLHAQLRRVGARLQQGIADCLDLHWKDHPAEARVRINADPAGRLVTLAVEGASSEAEICLGKILARGQYPRETDGVAELVLSYR